MVKYYIGEEKKVVQEERDFNKSIFHEQYKQAIRQIVELLDKPQTDVPNLIAFCGDRGEGKTSCMMTVSYIMEHASAPEIKDYLKCIPGNNLQNHQVEILPVIDPAFFDKDHNVLELLLGQLYTNYKNWQILNKEKKELIYGKTKNLTKQFQKAKFCLRHMATAETETYDPLEELEQLSAGIELGKCIKDLISDYLAMMGKDHLIIRIDDIDLNMSQAYKMCEQLRKYIVSERCLVMISVKIEQLLTTIENAIHIEASYPETIDISSMASKYVDKLIPMASRINMPKAYSLCDDGLEVYESRSSVEPIFKSRAVKEGIVRKIFYTSRFLFYNTKGMVSPIIPNNLRGLFNLLGLLFSMEDYNGDNTELEENKNIFKAYFYTSWTKQIKDEYRTFANEIINMGDSGELNKYVINSLRSLYDQSSADLLTKDIFNKSNFNYNISVGDVLYVVTNLDQQNVDENIKLYLFFIRSYYSIRLYESYDVITSNHKYIYPKSSDDGQLLKYDSWFERVNTLQKFLAGSYFTYIPDSILAPEGKGENSQPRDYRVISSQSGELTQMVSVIDALKDKYEELSDEDKKKFEQSFNVMEYFFLTIRHSIYERDLKLYKKSTRDQAVPKYITRYNTNTGYYVYDILCIFYSIINIEYAYDRFDNICAKHNESIDSTPRKSIYEFAKEHDFSLLRKMIGSVMEKCIEEGILDRDSVRAIDYSNAEEYWLCYHRLLSNSAIRNAEVAAAMIETIRNSRNSIRSSGSSALLISQFYKYIQNTHMMTYNRSEQETPYYLEFRFLEPICQFLKEINNKDKQEITCEGKTYKLPSFSDIFSFGLSDHNADYLDMSESEIKEYKKKLRSLFNNTFDKMSPITSKTLIERIRQKNPDLYSKLPELEWQNVFPDDKYTISHSLDALLKYYEMFFPKEATENESVNSDGDSLSLF